MLSPLSPAVPPLEEHLARVKEYVHLQSAAAPRCRRRGRQATEQQRLQQRIRQAAVDCYHDWQEQCQTLEQCGQLLGLSPRTLRFWEQRCRPGTIGLLPVGRPWQRSPLPVRQQIIDYLKLTGPGVGLPALQEQFRGVARGELADLLERFRAWWCRRHGQYGRVLHWQTAGRVWAADFTETSQLAPDLWPLASGYVLAVRDLASGCVLAWEPIPALTEEVACDQLARLFAVHGAPLVLKVDNGSAFRAALFQKFLEGAGTIPLYSPPSCPSYNGSIEATIGSLKKRTEEQARGQGRAGAWQPEDLSAAQAAANTSHPRRLNGRTPTSVWQTRPPIEAVERVVFALSAERQRFGVRDEQRIDQEKVLDHWRTSAVDRLALERALVEHGHLLFTRRRIPPRIRRRKVTADR